MPVTETPFSAWNKLKTGGDVSTVSTRAKLRSKRCSPVTLNSRAIANKQNNQNKWSVDWHKYRHLPHEGEELERKAGIISGQLLLFQEMHLCRRSNRDWSGDTDWPCRQGRAQSELNPGGWQRLLGGLRHLRKSSRDSPCSWPVPGSARWVWKEHTAMGFEWTALVCF